MSTASESTGAGGIDRHCMLRVRWLRASLPSAVAAGCLAYAAIATSQEAASPGPLEVEKGYLLSESGEWRTPNPAYEPGGAEPREFGINYRWGPHRKHIIGEIVGVGEKGKAVYATVYIMHNPVTEHIVVDLIGWDGTFGPAEERRIDDRNRIVEALRYMPDGTIKASRHAYELIDANSYVLRTYERNASAEWLLQRTETWRQLPRRDARSASGD